MYDNTSKYILFNYIINGICYLLILSFFIWDKIYYTSIHKTNDPTVYFITNNEKNINKSKKIDTDTDIDNEKRSNMLILNYINFYKFCSQIVMFNDGDFKFIGKRNKNTLKFVI